MARIKINLPGKFLYTTHLNVRISDINYGGHTGNDSVVTFMHEARMNFLNFLGIRDEVHIIPDIGLIVADLAVEYKSESFFGDRLEISIAVDDYHKYGFDMYYKIINPSGKVVAKGKTGVVFFNYKERKIAGAPEELIKKIQAL